MDETRLFIIIAGDEKPTTILQAKRSLMRGVLKNPSD
jgi:hypothetical protein